MSNSRPAIDQTKNLGQIKIYDLAVSRYSIEQDVPKDCDDFVAAILKHDEMLHMQPEAGLCYDELAFGNFNVNFFVDLSFPIAIK